MTPPAKAKVNKNRPYISSEGGATVLQRLGYSPDKNILKELREAKKRVDFLDAELRSTKRENRKCKKQAELLAEYICQLYVEIKSKDKKYITKEYWLNEYKGK